MVAVVILGAVVAVVLLGAVVVVVLLGIVVAVVLLGAVLAVVLLGAVVVVVVLLGAVAVVVVLGSVVGATGWLDAQYLLVAQVLARVHVVLEVGGRQNLHEVLAAKEEVHVLCEHEPVFSTSPPGRMGCHFPFGHFIFPFL